MLVSLAAGQLGVCKTINTLVFIDASKPYFHAPAQRPVYVVLPDVALSDSERRGRICGKLNYSLYGTRAAAQTWQGCLY